MAKRYPSLLRARKAFAAGYYGKGRNPYTNPVLLELWERGVKKATERALSGQGRPVPPMPLRKTEPKPATRPLGRRQPDQPFPRRRYT